MFSCIEIETVSLAFAILGLFATTLGSVMCIALMVYINVVISNDMNAAFRMNSTYLETNITTYGLQYNINLAVFLSIFAVALAFTIILTKGLISKKAHLVKTYFIYGVTMNAFSVISALGFCAYTAFLNPLSTLVLIGCLLYSFILRMFQKTYRKLSNTDTDQFCHKKLEAES